MILSYLKNHVDWTCKAEAFTKIFSSNFYSSRVTPKLNSYAWRCKKDIAYVKSIECSYRLFF